ncbi:hypothetical protein JCM19379_19560 [Methyloparacoccus murrellii]
MIGIKNRYTYQLPVVSRSVSRKTMLIPAVAGGVVAGSFLAIGFALFWRRYQLYRQHRAH